MAPIKENLKIIQGSTFQQVIRWESSTVVYKNITTITKTAPMVVTVIAHGLVVGWRALISNVAGMKEANSGDEYLKVTDTTADTVTFNEVNASGFSTYTSGGVLTFNAPVSLAGTTARMQISRYNS